MMKRYENRRVLLGTLFIVAGVACGSDGGGGKGGGDGDGDGDGDPTAASDFQSDVARVYCEAFEDCNQPFLAGYADVDDCAEDFARQIQNNTGDLAPLIAAGRVKYDAEHAPACLDALRMAACDVSRATPAVCTDTLDGTVAEGGDCNVNVECQGDAYCKEEAQCPGSCTVYAKAGESCVATKCDDSSFCNADGKCEAKGLAGVSCGGNTPVECAFGMRCIGDDDTTPGTCTSIDDIFAGSDGEACEIRSGKLCKVGLSCAVKSIDGQTQTVTQECTKPAASGEACSTALPQMCPVGEYCDVGTKQGSFEGSCRALVAEGKPCGPTVPCDEGLACVGNGDALVCKPLAKVGASCTAATECGSQRCEDGKCVTGLGCSL
jgi:hypothetical protein